MANLDIGPLEDDSFAKEEGVPTIDQPFIQKFLDGRDALIQQEKTQRSDHAFRTALSPMAREACAIVSQIRFQEQQTLWNAEYEDNLSNRHDGEVYPGMMFGLAKEKIEGSKLWQLVRRMPKGALLHCHFAAMGDLGQVIRDAIEEDGMAMSAQSPLKTDEARETVLFKFQYAPKASADGASIWSTTYEANTFVPLHKAAETFPNGGTESFINWFKARASLSHADSISHHLGPNDIWRKFRNCFGIIDGLLRYEPLLRKHIRTTLSQLNEDGVRWVDIRYDFVNPFYRQGQAEPEEGFEGTMEAFEEEIEAFQNSDAGKDFWGARLIWTSIRVQNTRGIVNDMKEAIRMKQLFPDLIAGYDLVGQEDLGRPLGDLVPELFWFRKTCAQEGVEMPFYFHAGETLGTGDEVDENLFDAVLLGTRRIGHGFSLYKHPLLIEMVKEKRILVESCPISNEILRLTPSINHHPLPALLARGVHCALCNDDPAILTSSPSGMSHDFFQALQGWESLGLEGLASLAENSVRWATFDDCSAKEWSQEVKDGAYGKGVRAERIQEWAKEFEKFCQWVVLEYGPETDLDTLD